MNSTNNSLSSSNQGKSLYNHKEQKDKIGVSNLKILDGEDLTYGDRKRLQALQQKDWIEQQIREKEERKLAEKAAQQAFDQQTLALNFMKTNLEEDHTNKRKVMAIAYQEANKQLAKEKYDKDKDQRTKEDQDKKNHIEYNLNNDFYTENPDTCKSYVSENRVLKYHWKGMNESQKKEILDEQEKQMKQTQMKKKQKEEEDKMYAIQTEHQRIMQIKMEREKMRRKEELLKNQKEFNLLKNEEQKLTLKSQYDVKIGQPQKDILS